MSEPGTSGDGTVAFLHEAGYLKHLPRTGWQIIGVPQPESVAEHSYRVGLIAFVLATLEGANADRAAVLGLLHDLPECRIGDVPLLGKPHVTTRDAVEVIGLQTEAVAEPARAALRAAVAEYEGRDTAEARCAKDADRIECLLQAREYGARGNPLVQPWVDSCLAGVTTDAGRRLAAAARETDPNDWWRLARAPVSAARRPPGR
ncbi:haloacid dehalogenase [Pilimelia anulata]|uniref:5'-deoxynucleotidase n=1 Tax=Pilimelia anulata TaxID=53371 RepID=A0A8J3B3R8_9ACTN|nr:HD domain-containing protein [Pilimelia anulata]GGJ93583.1 haloacid dehalogenase [Pilimelia anulata]